MKKLILLSLSVFLGLQLAVNSSAKAQNFHIVASFGSTHNWGVPAAIVYEVDYFYPYHRFVHVDRVWGRGRNVFFNVLLERNGRFIELTFGQNGQIFQENFFVNYPLVNHICSSHCGYHSNYYLQQRVVCQSHHHRGHNHVNYRQPPRRVVYANNYHRNTVHYASRNNTYRGNNRNYNRTDFNKPFSRNSSRVVATSASASRAASARSTGRSYNTSSTNRVADISTSRNSTTRSTAVRSNTAREPVVNNRTGSSSERARTTSVSSSSTRRSGTGRLNARSRSVKSSDAGSTSVRNSNNRNASIKSSNTRNSSVKSSSTRNTNDRKARTSTTSGRSSSRNSNDRN